MADLITVDQLQESYDIESESRAAGVISDVSALVISYAQHVGVASTTTDTWDETATPDAIQAVVKSIVYGVLDNPAGYTGETLGDHGWQSNPRSRLGVLLGREEKRAIRQAVGKSSFGDVTQEGYLPVQPKVLTDDDLVL